MTEEKEEKNKGGPPPKELTLQAIQKGPFTSAHQKWVAIAKYFTINSQRALQKGYRPIPIKDFCEWTGVTEAEVYDAPLTKEYIDVALAAKAGEAQIWFASELPRWKESLQRMYDKGDYKEYSRGMAQLADIIKFKQADTSYLIPADDVGPEETVKSVMKVMEEIFGRDAVVQRIIPRLAQDDGARGESTAGLVPVDASPEGNPSTLQQN